MFLENTNTLWHLSPVTIIRFRVHSNPVSGLHLVLRNISKFRVTVWNVGMRTVARVRRLSVTVHVLDTP